MKNKLYKCVVDHMDWKSKITCLCNNNRKWWIGLQGPSDMFGVSEDLETLALRTDIDLHDGNFINIITCPDCGYVIGYNSPDMMIPVDNDDVFIRMFS